MKKLIFFIALSVSLNSWANKSLKEFNETFHREIDREIKKDEDKFKKSPIRGPASVPDVVERPMMKEPSKIDKNVRQIGPNEW